MAIHLPSGKNRDEWQLAIWNADDAAVSRSQKLVLMLMLEASFNNFDAFRVVGDLLTHRGLWDGAVMGRGASVPRTANGPFLHGDLLELRDIAGGHWNVDTVYVLHQAVNTAALTALAEGWQADEIHTYTGSQSGSLLGASGRTEHILRVWWD